jgi:hypothetical protein
MGTSSFSASRSFGLFDDEVFNAGDLQKKSSQILDRAQRNPVTINRNSERFALLRRDLAARLWRAKNQFAPVAELINSIVIVAENKQPPEALQWLKVFDIDDLRQMTHEVTFACICALRDDGDWDAVDTVIHQWHESALVTMSGVLKEAMESQAEEVPLTDPREAVGAEPELVPTAHK